MSIKLSKKAELNIRRSIEDKDDFYKELEIELNDYEIEPLEKFEILMQYKDSTFYVRVKEQLGVLFVEDVRSLHMINVK